MRLLVITLLVYSWSVSAVEVAPQCSLKLGDTCDLMKNMCCEGKCKQFRSGNNCAVDGVALDEACGKWRYCQGRLNCGASGFCRERAPLSAGQSY